MKDKHTKINRTTKMEVLNLSSFHQQKGYSSKSSSYHYEN